MTKPLQPGCTMTDIRRNRVSIRSAAVMVTSPEGQPMQTPLLLDPLVVGTDRDCDLVVTDSHVSRRHCEVRLTEQGILVKDLGSKNGTFLGDVQIREAILPAGMSVTFGQSRLSIHDAGSQTAVPLFVSNQFDRAVGESMLMRALFAKLERAANGAEPILLVGESGTGKGLLASCTHEISTRKNGPFLAMDGGLAAAHHTETDLLGHTKGGPGLLEQASGGTLLINDIDALPPHVQPKLLRAIESGFVCRVGSGERYRFDTRIIATSIRDVRSNVAEGRFLQNLYYALAVSKARVPPLRERREDIPLLVQHFLAAQTPSKSVGDLPSNILDIFTGYSWPGNVSELRSTVSRLLLYPYLGQEAITGLQRNEQDDGLRAYLQLGLEDARKQVVEDFDKRYIVAKLGAHANNKTEAAKSMGITRQGLYKLISKYGINSKD